jgi:hypothetical protein
MGSRSRRSSRDSQQQSEQSEQQRREVETSLQGPKHSIGGDAALLDVATPEDYIAGANLKVGGVNGEAGMDENGVYGSAGATVGEVGVRLGRDDDVAQLNAKAEGPNANAEGRFGWDGIGFDAGASVGDVSAEGHLGRRGTENDAAITGGLEAGGGGKLSLGANFGRDTDGDGVPNYGFNIGAKLGVGFNVGVDVERPMEHLRNAGSAVAGWFGF